MQEATDAFKERVSNVLEETVPTLCEKVVKTVETTKRERIKETIEEEVRDHLRGFARTIPSFLMAYGDDETTLSTFDMIIPDDVFYEVTSITLDQFRFLRDGGSYTDAETGEKSAIPESCLILWYLMIPSKNFSHCVHGWAITLMSRIQRIFSTTSHHRRPIRFHAQAYREADGQYAGAGKSRLFR